MIWEFLYRLFHYSPCAYLLSRVRCAVIRFATTSWAISVLTDYAPLQWLSAQKMDGLLVKWTLAIQEYELSWTVCGYDAGVFIYIAIALLHLAISV